ncbi:MAG: ABC transporter ATP-binding protein/permease [Candidatus Omnitrophica bacterium]|nr:ABC transporter ATP-binding protein/permease [Candidatus Omnitrophota bacterium]
MKLYLNLVRLIKFFHRIDVKLSHFIFPVVLALGAALFEGLSITLLIPTVRGIIKADFIFVREVPILKNIIEQIPDSLSATNTSLFILLLVMIATTAVAKNIFQYLSAVGIARQVRKFSNQLRKNIFKRYLGFGKKHFDLNSTGSLNQVLIGFTNKISSQLMILENSCILILMLVVYIIIMVMISWKLTIFAMLVFPLVFYSSQWLIDKIKKSSVVWAGAHTVLGQSIFNILSNMLLVKACVAEKKEEHRFSKASDAIEELEFNVDRKRYLVPLVHEIIALVMLLLFIAATAFLIVKKQSGDVAIFAVYIVIIKRIFTYSKGLGLFRVSLANIEGPMRSILKVFDDKNKFFVNGGRKEFKQLNESIDFRHLNFFYKKGIQTLKDVSFSVEKGKMTAIVGSTGAGKTTLISLILRFYDCPPSTIFIDGTDIREFTVESLRGQIALVSQDSALFNDTLRNNITYGLDRECSEEEIMVVAKKARLHEVILKASKGLDSLVGDRGVQLSGGEKQRVSIARAVLRRSEILILDEATSSLDTHTERLIQEAVEQMVKGKTAITIAHRLSTIKNADKIVVIEDGRFIEEGDLTELLKKKGKFYQYWEEQKFY